jgi:hypothetical protein
MVRSAEEVPIPLEPHPEQTTAPSLSSPHDALVIFALLEAL